MSDTAPNDHEQLMAEILQCAACRLRLTRNNAVLYRGPIDAPLMLVGEAPGQQEDTFGKPFVGPSGQLLSRLLARAGIIESRVYLCNVVKCRPPTNRNPTQTEIRCCRPWLVGQIQLVKPNVIIAMGKVATIALTETRGPMNVLLDHDDLTCSVCKDPSDIPIIPIYHPAYLIRRLDDPRASEVFKDTVARLTRGWHQATAKWDPPAEF